MAKPQPLRVLIYGGSDGLRIALAQMLRLHLEREPPLVASSSGLETLPVCLHPMAGKPQLPLDVMEITPGYDPERVARQVERAGREIPEREQPRTCAEAARQLEADFPPGCLVQLKSGGAVWVVDYTCATRVYVLRMTPAGEVEDEDFGPHVLRKVEDLDDDIPF